MPTKTRFGVAGGPPRAGHACDVSSPILAFRDFFDCHLLRKSENTSLISWFPEFTTSAKFASAIFDS